MAKPIQPPKGTRDFYPRDLLRRRYIEKLWRDTSIRHGFEEIEGPTFEAAELYKVKSGEGILAEMFGVFSGKAEEDLKQLRETGEAPFTLRPEFTPTLARMYAARAGSLPKPTKWFTAGPYFRAERPQRGRLREFYQWNLDVIGEPSPLPDADVIACAIGMFEAAGFLPEGIRCHYSSRETVRGILAAIGSAEPTHDAILALLDKRAKMPPEKFGDLARAAGFDIGAFDAKAAEMALREGDGGVARELGTLGLAGWCVRDLGIVRGIAYYTGHVFELLATGERAIAGGGRYDNLIELFGGPPTPAVGFGMGDVVLGNLLDDKGLMPDGPALLDAISAPGASLRPDVFVISNATDSADAQVRPLVAALRRGVESQAWLDRAGRKPWDRDRYTVPPLHARHSYRATKNIGKLLEEASKQHARFAAIIEDGERCTLKNLAGGEQIRDVALGEVGGRAARGA